MYLYNIKLWNFRKYGSDNAFDLKKPDLNLFFQKGLNLLIGENDSGKTAIIDAIKIALKTTSYEWVYVSPEDFFNNANRLRIELKFFDMKADEAKHFTEFLSWEEIGDKKEPVLNVIYDVNRKDGRIVPTDLKAGSDQIGRALPAEVRDKLKVTYLKPLRDAKTELIPKKNSRLSQIFQEHEAFKEKEDEKHVLIKIYEEFNDAIRFYFKGQDKDGHTLAEDQKGKELKNSIDDSIKGFFDDKSETNINTSKAEIKRILESLELSLEGVVNPGLGSLNRLFMASELIHLNRTDWTGLKLGLIEEIEAHLHPQVQLKVIESIQKQDETQLIVTTHSPNLASKVELKRIIICRNSSAYPLAPEFTMLDSQNYVFLEKFLDVTKSNLFFARGLLFVEGWAEEILVPVLAKKIGYDLVKHEVSVINVGNLGFSNYYKIFTRKDGEDMNIPLAIITDCDVRAYDEIINNSIKIYNKKDTKEYIIDCLSAAEEIKKRYPDNVNPFISLEWTFEWCLYNSSIFHNKFVDIVKEIHSKTNWSDFETKLAEKLIKKTLNKTEIAYKLARAIEDNEITLSLPELEKDKYICYIIGAIKHVCK